MESLRFCYQLISKADQVESLAREITIEQSVEVPEELITEDIRRQHIAKINYLTEVAFPKNLSHYQDSLNCYNLELEYPLHCTDQQIPQLLNMLFGNISMQRGIKVISMKLPDSFVSNFTGPRFGIEGIRKGLGAFGRPLLATALKPKGLSLKDLGKLAYQFACGGGDILKDDHNFAASKASDFRERVTAVLKSLSEARNETGRKTLYFANLVAPQEELQDQLDFMADAGVDGVLLSPTLLGIDNVRSIIKRAPKLMVMAHPTMSGLFYQDPTHGISHDVLFGQLYRLLGIDLSTYPNSGGRFAFEATDCKAVAQRLLEPMGELKSTFPVLAGGMSKKMIPYMARDFGEDAVYLIGGALLAHSSDLTSSTREFSELIGKHFPQAKQDFNPLQQSSPAAAVSGSTGLASPKK